MDGPAGGRGKWSEAGVPHRGWACDDIEDLGTPLATCEMCGTEIRFVHYMSHEDYPKVLACGCVCAGHMEENLARAERRDKRMRSSARHRAHWPERKGWHLSGKGNLTIRANGYRVTVMARQSGRFEASLAPLGDGKVIYSQRTYPTRRAAQLAAFDKMMQIDDA